MKFDNLIFVDCEAIGMGAPVAGLLTEFGAVHYTSRSTFRGVLLPHAHFTEWVGKHVDALPDDILSRQRSLLQPTFEAFELWMENLSRQKRYTMVSDNPAFDWQWINDGFIRTLGYNPMGFSARRIGDFYAGLCGDFNRASDWKALRRTAHDHDPVNDAMGNAEAFERMLAGERAERPQRGER